MAIYKKRGQKVSYIELRIKFQDVRRRWRQEGAWRLPRGRGSRSREENRQLPHCSLSLSLSLPLTHEHTPSRTLELTKAWWMWAQFTHLGGCDLCACVSLSRPIWAKERERERKKKPRRRQYLSTFPASESGWCAMSICFQLEELWLHTWGATLDASNALSVSHIISLCQVVFFGDEENNFQRLPLPPSMSCANACFLLSKLLTGHFGPVRLVWCLSGVVLPLWLMSCEHRVVIFCRSLALFLVRPQEVRARTHTQVHVHVRKFLREEIHHSWLNLRKCLPACQALSKVFKFRQVCDLTNMPPFPKGPAGCRDKWADPLVRC